MESLTTHNKDYKISRLKKVQSAFEDVIKKNLNWIYFIFQILIWIGITTIAFLFYKSF
jgi:hypothetical protein